MAARDPKQPVHIDLEDDDSVELIPWEYVVDKCDKIIGQKISPDIRQINIDLGRMRDVLKRWVEEQGGGDNNE